MNSLCSCNVFHCFLKSFFLCFLKDKTPCHSSLTRKRKGREGHKIVILERRQEEEEFIGLTVKLVI